MSSRRSPAFGQSSSGAGQRCSYAAYSLPVRRIIDECTYVCIENIEMFAKGQPQNVVNPPD